MVMLAALPTPRHARAFTLLEATLVLFALAVLGAIGVATFGGTDILVADRSAQANADVVLDALVEHAAAATTPSADPERLASMVPSEVTVLDATTGADAAGEVSAAAQGTLAGPSAVAVAARGADGSCWFAYLALEAAPDMPRRRFSIATPPAATACTGTAALDSATASAPQGRGSAWSTPVLVP